MKRLCLEPRCPESATYRGRCSTHSAQRERSINRAGRKVYNSKRWKLLRRRKLTLDSICEHCKNALATDVHHRHGVAEDPWSLDGLESLCRSCHSRETRREQGKGRVAA